MVNVTARLAARATRVVTRTLLPVLLLAAIAACGTPTGSPQAVTFRVRMASSASLHPAAGTVPRVEVLVYGCVESDPCHADAVDAAILEFDADGRLTGDRCEGEGMGCELEFTSANPSRTVWLLPGSYALRAEAYQAGAEAPAYCSAISFQVPATSDTVDVPMLPDCPGGGDGGWLTQFGSDLDDQASRVAVDHDGYVYVAGTTRGVLPAAAEAKSCDPNCPPDVFITKLGPDGAHIVTRQFISDSDDGEDVSGLAIDDQGRAVIVSNTVGDSRIIVRAVSKSDGADVWTETISSGAADWAVAVVMDDEGSLLVAGGTVGTLEDGKSPELLTSAFVRKLDQDGAHVWTHQFEDLALGTATALATDAAGNVYVAGMKDAPRNVFVSKLDADGSLSWTWIPPESSGKNDHAEAIALDARGGVLVAGTTEGSFQGESKVSEPSYVDAFLLRLDPSAPELDWVHQFAIGEVASNQAEARAVLPTGEVIVSGQDVRGDAHVMVAKLQDATFTPWTYTFGTDHSDSAAAAITGLGEAVIVGHTAGDLTGEARTCDSPCDEDAFALKVVW